MGDVSREMLLYLQSLELKIHTNSGRKNCQTLPTTKKDFVKNT